MLSDLADTARKSFSLSNTLQVVEKYRKDYPDLRKKHEPHYESNFILLTSICILFC